MAAEGWQEKAWKSWKICEKSQEMKVWPRLMAKVRDNERLTFISHHFSFSFSIPHPPPFLVAPQCSPCLSRTARWNKKQRGCLSAPHCSVPCISKRNYSGSGNNCLFQLWIHLMWWFSSLMGRKFPGAILNNVWKIRCGSVSVAINIYESNFTTHNNLKWDTTMMR